MIYNSCMGSILRPSYHLIRQIVLSLRAILLVCIVLPGILLTSIMQVPLRSAEAAGAEPPVQRFAAPDEKPISCKITIQNKDSSLRDIARRFQTAFKALCPTLVKRFFAQRPDIASNVKVVFKSHSNMPRYESGSGACGSNNCGFVIKGSRTININADRAQERPLWFVGIFIHELTHVIQYKASAPGWFREGMADYVFSVYTPVGGELRLPDSVAKGDHYTKGYEITARFLHWLEQNTIPDIVDRLIQAAQTGQSFSEAFQRLTGGTADELWEKYKANPELKLMKRMPVPV